jgi:hypothetical protein
MVVLDVLEWLRKCGVADLIVELYLPRQQFGETQMSTSKIFGEIR